MSSDPDGDYGCDALVLATISQQFHDLSGGRHHSGAVLWRDGGYHEREGGRPHARRGQTGFIGRKAFGVPWTAQDTKHTSMFDWTLPAGFSTGTHVHRVQEETFYVLEGECEWHVGGQLIHAKPGTYVFIPPGVPHNIAMTAQDTKHTSMFDWTLPAGFSTGTHVHRDFGSQADVCAAPTRVRFTSDSDLESGFPQSSMSALPPKEKRPVITNA